METQPKPAVTGYPAPAHPPYAAASSASAPAHGTAYPYPAPPYYPAPPPPYYDHTAAYTPATSSALFLRRLIIFCISIFLFVGLATFILWLVLRPHLPEFAVSSASVSSFALSGNQQLSADFNLTLSVRNRNKKMAIFYDRVEAAVFYGRYPIAETSLPPFYQGKGNSTVVPARFAAIAEYVDPDVAGGIAKEKSGGGINFHVRVVAWVRFRAGAWRTRRHVMRVFCDGVRIGFSNATATVGSLLGQPRPCQVDF